MTKEEIDNLEDYLRKYLPKIEPTIPIPIFESVGLDDLIDSIRQFKKVPTSDELLRENKRLRKQLEEKGKVIDEAIEQVNKIIIKPTPFFKELEGSILAPKEEADKLLEILERGKNDN